MEPVVSQLYRMCFKMLFEMNFSHTLESYHFRPLTFDWLLPVGALGALYLQNVFLCHTCIWFSSLFG